MFMASPEDMPFIPLMSFPMEQLSSRPETPAIEVEVGAIGHVLVSRSASGRRANGTGRRIRWRRRVERVSFFFSQCEFLDRLGTASVGANHTSLGPQPSSPGWSLGAGWRFRHRQLLSAVVRQRGAETSSPNFDSQQSRRRSVAPKDDDTQTRQKETEGPHEEALAISPRQHCAPRRHERAGRAAGAGAGRAIVLSLWQPPRQASIRRKFACRTLWR